MISEDDQKYFCYFYIRVFGAALYGFLQIGIGVVLLIMAIRQYKKTVDLTTITRNIKFIYLSLFGQCVFFIVRIIFYESLFWIFRHQPHTVQQLKRMSMLSKFTAVVDIFGVFSIQAMLILVCYNWMDKTVDILQQLAQYEDDQETDPTNNMKNDQLLRFEKICSRIIKNYMIFRCLLYLFCAVYFLIVPGNPQGALFIIILMYILIQSIFVGVILAIGIFAIKRNKKWILIVGWEQIKIMINQYVVLLICSIVRSSFGSFLVVKGIQNKINETQCFIQRQTQTLDQFKIVGIYIFEDLFCYFIPVIMVLRIFQVASKNSEISASLLNTGFKSSIKSGTSLGKSSSD